MSLDPIISAAYGSDCRTRVSTKLGRLYESSALATWDFLRNAFEVRDTPPPTLEVVHSPVARPTTIRGAKSRTVVVYDQYLGQIFNQLTRMVRGDASPAIVDHYINKLYAQRALVAGRRRTAALFGLLAKAIKVELPVEAASELNQRGQLAIMQEVFVIAHELTHLVLSENPAAGQERIQWYTDVMLLVHDLPFHHADFPDLTAPADLAWQIEKGRHDSFLRAIERRGIAADGVTSTIRPEQAAKLIKTRVDMFNIAAKDPVLLEECVCDAFGYLVTLKVLAKNDANILMGTSAAALALHNLRLIQLLDRLMLKRQRSDDLEDLSDLFAQSAARLSMIRAFSAAMMVMNGYHDLAREVQNEGVQVNEAHSKVLLDQVMFCMPFQAWETRLEQMSEVTRSAADYETDPTALRGLLGFATRS